MKAEIKLLRSTAQLPEYQTPGSAGLDLHAAIREKRTVFANRASTIIPTGVAIKIPDKHVGLLCIRSSTAVKGGLMLVNGVGVIDSDYQGEIMIALRASVSAVEIHPGERIAQLVIAPCPQLQLVQVEEFTQKTKRGTGGIGSTGKGGKPNAS